MTDYEQLFTSDQRWRFVVRISRPIEPKECPHIPPTAPQYVYSRSVIMPNTNASSAEEENSRQPQLLWSQSLRSPACSSFERDPTRWPSDPSILSSSAPPPYTQEEANVVITNASASADAEVEKKEGDENDIGQMPVVVNSTQD